MSEIIWVAHWRVPFSPFSPVWVAEASRFKNTKRTGCLRPPPLPEREFEALPGAPFLQNSSVSPLVEGDVTAAYLNMFALKPYRALFVIFFNSVDQHFLFNYLMP